MNRTPDDKPFRNGLLDWSFGAVFNLAEQMRQGRAWEDDQVFVEAAHLRGSVVSYEPIRRRCGFGRATIALVRSLRSKTKTANSYGLRRTTTIRASAGSNPTSFQQRY
jgi:hypothetical protein